MEAITKPIAGFKTVGPNDVDHELIKRISEDWMLITAEKPNGSFNTMTASWGSTGFLWGRPIFTCFVRPQRYTYEFTEESELITLSFFDESYRAALRFCGSKSGREFDKAKECGLEARHDIDGAVFFSEASLVLVGRKLYAADLKAEDFIDRSIIDSCYKAGDFHRAYTCEILGVLEKEE